MVTSDDLDARSYPQARAVDGSTNTMPIPAPRNPTQTIPCPKGCGATIHHTDWDDNHGFHTSPRHIDPHPLTHAEALACILAGRPIHTWRTDRAGRHWHGHPSPWHPATRHAPSHRCGKKFPAHDEPEQPLELDTPHHNDPGY